VARRHGTGFTPAVESGRGADVALLFFFETLTLLGLAACLIWFGALTYQAWLRPSESWRELRARIAYRRAWLQRSGLGWLPVDILGFENHKDRYVLFARATFVILDVWLAVSLIGFAYLFFMR
jgi:hypothetical protein